MLRRVGSRSKAHHDGSHGTQHVNHLDLSSKLNLRKSLAHPRQNKAMLYTKIAVMLSSLFYLGLAFVTWQAARGVSVPIPTTRDLVPMTLGHANYQDVYDAFQKSKHGDDAEADSGDERWQINHFASLTTYGDEIRCSMTVVMVDPHIPTLKTGAPSLFTLESVAAFAPKACVVIQTAKCHFNSTIPQTNMLSREDEIYLRTYDLAEELFREMIDDGRVRMTFLDHEKYNLKACNDFSNLSNALMNLDYWKDEFLPNDSDTVMILQEGSVLCHSFDVEKYRKFAYVGAPLKKDDPIFHGADVCDLMLEQWRKYTMPQQNWMAQSLGSSDHSNKPDGIFVDVKFQEFCSNGIAPLTIDGITLRSRKAMMEAIITCPHRKWSGIKLDDLHPACTSVEDNNHLYFSTVLPAIGAKLPTGFEASFFAVEQLWPEDALKIYGGPFFQFKRQIIASESSCIYGGASTGGKKRTVPIGFYKPWLYHTKDDLASTDVGDQCPFLKYVV